MTIALYIAITFICAMPLIMDLFKRNPSGVTPSFQDTERAFYVAQFNALEDEKLAHRLEESEVRDAQTEIARRILRAGNQQNTRSRAVSSRVIVVLTLLLPILGTGLYLVKGEPGYGPQPASTSRREIDPSIRPLIARLEEQLSLVQPDEPGYVKLHLLLAAVSEKQDRPREALSLYREALRAQFQPLLAIHIADLQSQLDRRINEESLHLYQRALDTAPKDAPWRLEVQKRIAQGEHDTQPIP